MRAQARRPLIRAAAVACLVAGGIGVVASHAGAQGGGGLRRTDVVQVNGLIDPANAALIEDAIREAPGNGTTLLVFQIDGTGSVDTDVDRIVDRMRASKVPIAVWVGPSGADAKGAAALLTLAANVNAVAQGAGIGTVDPVELDDPDRRTERELREVLRDLQTASDRSPNVDPLVHGHLSARAAADRDLVNRAEPTIGGFIASLDGVTVPTARGPVTLDTAVSEGTGAERETTLVNVHFQKLDLAGQLAHTLVTPWVAYLLFVVGFLLIIFEFFTAGVGIAGLIGAVAVACACFGFSHLPVQGWAIALLLVGLLGFTIDLQAGGLGPWTFIGGVALVLGSAFLYGGSSRLDPAWWVIALVCGGTAVFMLGGMTAMIRSRFSTPTIGREDLVGEMGTAEVPVNPDGVVRIRDALWRARTNRATPIAAGDAVRVVAVEGIVLEVEPEAGGARDYRERRPRA